MLAVPGKNTIREVTLKKKINKKKKGKKPQKQQQKKPLATISFW